MSGTAVAVLLLFVFSLVSSSRISPGHQQYKSPAKFQQTMQISLENLPPADFNAVATDEASVQNSITRYVLTHGSKLSRDELDKMVSATMTYSKQYNVNPKLVVAMIDRESGFNPMAVSTSGAMGFAQLLPSTAAGIGIRDPHDIDEGTKGAALYLKMMLDRWAGNPNQVPLALGSYAEGYTAVMKKGGYSDATAAYIRDILNNYNAMN